MTDPLVCSGIFSRRHDGQDVRRVRVGGLWRPICHGCRVGLGLAFPDAIDPAIASKPVAGERFSSPATDSGATAA